MLYARPSYHALNLLKEKGLTMVVSCISKAEGVKDIEKMCKNLNLKHFWIELGQANDEVLGKPSI